MITRQLKPWQPGWHQMELLVAPGFPLLCYLLRTDMKDVFIDFMRAVVNDSSCKDPLQHQRATEYFINCGYHQGQFSNEDYRALMEELLSVAALWPRGADTNFVILHAKWRNHYHQWWYIKWKGCRKTPVLSNPASA